MFRFLLILFSVALKANVLQPAPNASIGDGNARMPSRFTYMEPMSREKDIGIIEVDNHNSSQDSSLRTITPPLDHEAQIVDEGTQSLVHARNQEDTTAKSMLQSMMTVGSIFRNTFVHSDAVVRPGI